MRKKYNLIILNLNKCSSQRNGPQCIGKTDNWIKQLTILIGIYKVISQGNHVMSVHGSLSTLCTPLSLELMVTSIQFPLSHVESILQYPSQMNTHMNLIYRTCLHSISYPSFLGKRWIWKLIRWIIRKCIWVLYIVFM